MFTKFTDVQQSFNSLKKLIKHTKQAENSVQDTTKIKYIKTGFFRVLHDPVIVIEEKLITWLHSLCQPSWVSVPAGWLTDFQLRMQSSQRCLHPDCSAGNGEASCRAPS